MSDGVTVRFKGKGRDEDGFVVDVLEHPITGQQFLAYSPEDWASKVRFHQELRKLQEREEVGRQDQAA